MKHICTIILWSFCSIVVLVMAMSTAVVVHKPKIQALETESTFVKSDKADSQPGIVLAAQSQDTKVELRAEAVYADVRELKIKNYLEKYNSPMASHSALILQTADLLADELEIDATNLAYLTIAIAQNESNLGKKMPDNNACVNAWGWGIHSAGKLCFENWEEAIYKYMSGFARNYIYARGLDTPEEIMTLYTPHSPEGAWAKKVAYFMEEIKNNNK